MDFNDLIADFSTRHKVENIVVAAKAAAQPPPKQDPSFGASDFMQV